MLHFIFQHQRLVHTSTQPLQHQQFLRFAPGVRPATVEQYEQLLHRQTQAQNVQGGVLRLPLNQTSVIQRPPVGPPQAVGGQTEGVNAEEGIPDNVTAELEKLEQETGKKFRSSYISIIYSKLDIMAYKEFHFSKIVLR